MLTSNYRILILLLIIFPIYTGVIALPALSVRQKTASRTDCLPYDHLLASIQKLSYSVSQAEFDEVRKILIGEADRSAVCRQQVIASLLERTEDSAPQRPREISDFLFWRYRAELLGNLRAVEVIDQLINHISVSDRLSSSLSHYPVVRGLIKMGPLAIPKLAAVVRYEADPYVRRKAIFCIAQIGGPEAMQALREAKSLDKNRCNNKFIGLSIKAFQNKAFPNQITSEDRPDWYAAFFCH